MALTNIVRRALERWFGRWHEGYEMPERFADVAADFANRHPKATRAEWLAFCQAHARYVYRAAWQRGYENAERSGEPPPWERVDPDVVADLRDPDWRNGRGIDLSGDAAHVPVEDAREEMGDEDPGG